MQKIVPFLWFNNQAEEAVNFYVSIFKNSKIGRISRFGEAGPGPKGAVMSVTFQLEDQEFYALNGGPQFTFTPAISLFVNCETQAEVDELWQKLLAGGKPNHCGWLTDKFGLSWQIIPTALGKLMSDPDPQKSSRVMKAMLQMDKIDVKGLEQAYQGTWSRRPILMFWRFRTWRSVASRGCPLLQPSRVALKELLRSTAASVPLQAAQPCRTIAAQSSSR